MCLTERRTSKSSGSLAVMDLGGVLVRVSFTLSPPLLPIDNLCGSCTWKGSGWTWPLVQFHGLKDVTVAFSFSSELWPSMEAVVRHVAPSVEILHLSASDRGPSCSISLPITEILCDDGKAHAPPIALMMPNLRELTAPLRVSPYPTRVFNTMNVKYSSLTKLGLHLHTEDGLLNVPLCSLRLPHLRTLWLSFASVDPAPGIWSGRYEFTELREFRIKGRHDSGRGGLDVSVLCGDDVSLPLSQSVRPRWGTLDSAFRLSSGAP